MSVGSPDITSCDFIKLARYINMVLEEDGSEEEEIHGIVVLTGTDTLVGVGLFPLSCHQVRKTRCCNWRNAASYSYEC